MNNTNIVEPHSGREHTDEELKALSVMYWQLHERGVPVQEGLAKAFDIPVSTMCKRIMAARARGFLSESAKERKRSPIVIEENVKNFLAKSKTVPTIHKISSQTTYTHKEVELAMIAIAYKSVRN
jgi:hypothetical protein